MKIKKAKFTVEEVHTDRYMAIGRLDNDEIWCDGAIVGDKRVAQRIADNMEAAYKFGLNQMIEEISKVIDELMKEEF